MGCGPIKNWFKPMKAQFHTTKYLIKSKIIPGFETHVLPLIGEKQSLQVIIRNTTSTAISPPLLHGQTWDQLQDLTGW